MKRHPFHAGFAPRSALGQFLYTFYAEDCDDGAVQACFRQGSLAFDPVELAIWWQSKRPLMAADLWQQGARHLFAMISECGCDEWQEAADRLAIDVDAAARGGRRAPVDDVFGPMGIRRCAPPLAEPPTPRCRRGDGPATALRRMTHRLPNTA
ncbi:hypothetical protein [Thiomonas sp. FB-Cd]|uniref:hypothetical protein n=1 Tax=Thiomonas sp. FB-Cd TaxID=1158292 RepID=UPI0004DEEC99|nr:hypothetical protein [Thiomonas sp. FB-Cd]